MTEPALNVLVVDDDDVTAECVSRSLKKFNLNCIVTAAEDGRDALSVLRGQTNRSVRKPYVILLDLNMPRMSGIEFLRELRSDPKLSQTTVVVLTTSDEERDRLEAYNLHVAGYLVKPLRFAAFVDLMSVVNRYWTLTEMV